MSRGNPSNSDFERVEVGMGLGGGGGVANLHNQVFLGVASDTACSFRAALVTVWSRWSISACESVRLVQNFSTIFEFTRSGSTTRFKYLHYKTEYIDQSLYQCQLTVETVRDALDEAVE